MFYQDLITVLIWWTVWVGFGVIGWPLTRKIFRNWENQGYLLAKALGVGVVSYVVWWLGSLRILPFTAWGIWGVAIGLGIITHVKLKTKTHVKFRRILAEEAIFLGSLLLWTWVKGNEPTINGLEKFMDYGFTKSIMQGAYFPPKDMWYAGESINYYYFGHLMMGLVTKASGINLSYSFNLMLATIFALCMSMSWAIARELLSKSRLLFRGFGAGISAVIVSVGGNLHTIYAFTKGYSGDNPPPFWTIWSQFWNKESFEMGWRSYWYPNATRFIPWTIHEFPSYSFVVSDMHGHVLAIPFSLLLISLALVLFKDTGKRRNIWIMALYGWVASWSMMTNALDGPIYIGLLGVLILWFSWDKSKWRNKDWWFARLKEFSPAIIAFVVGLAPFLLSFKPFVSGVAVNCPLKALENSRFGPLLFETVDKCQKSPIWMLLVLWGFFLYNGIALAYKKVPEEEKVTKKWLMGVSLVCLGLIIFPEFLYFKDIYPMHFRSNTMFKLGYQAFIMMGLLSGYTITQYLSDKKKKWWYLITLAPLLYLVLIYPNFAVRSYFGELRTYQGIYGLQWLENKYPDDAAAISWLTKTEPFPNQPVVLEANGDSYTDYDRISTFTGLPTIAGWTVHEWLWRGGYEPISARAEEVRNIYELTDVDVTKEILAKYKVKYVVIGDMEKQRYVNLSEEKFGLLGKVVFEQGTIKIYQVY